MGETIISKMKLHPLSSFETIHNYIDTENKILRKGAVSAQAGETIIIPINMKDGALICSGRGNSDWNHTAPHGSGRVLRRSEAKELITLDEFKAEKEGVFTTSVNGSTIDESPMAYRRIDEIPNVIDLRQKLRSVSYLFIILKQADRSQTRTQWTGKIKACFARRGFMPVWGVLFTERTVKCQKHRLAAASFCRTNSMLQCCIHNAGDIIMALERTVLTDEIAAQILYRYYGISFVSMQKLKLGTANCFRVYDGKQYYFMKEFQGSFPKSSVIREAKLVYHLSSAGIPVARFYKTTENEFATDHRGHVICLEEYIDGQTFSYDDLPTELLPQVGKMLGKLHRALKNYPLPAGMDDKWLDSFSAGNMTAQYDDLIKIAESKPGDKNASRIVDDLQYKKALAARCEEYKKYYRGITYCSTHGDYQGCQLIFDGNDIKAVVDFSSAARLPAVWELMRSFVQSAAACRADAQIDISAFCEYVRGYTEFSPLTKIDMRAMPYVYLFQLARSRYGYPQYLNSDSEDSEGLLRFAFWRTKICREVEKNSEAIAGALLRLLECEYI